MTLLSFIIIILLFSCLAGMIGALTGLGGGAFVIPFLVLFMHVNMHYALGAGLFAVMATSMGTAMAYLKQGYINIRIGMFLEVAAATGAIVGAYITTYLPAAIVQIIFGLVFIVMFYLSWRRRNEAEVMPGDQNRLAAYLKLDGIYPSATGKQAYLVQRTLLGFTMMIIAGIFSGLLGIGSGTLKVVAMDQAMRLPYKVSTSTSNFIIGITAAVGASIFFAQGYVHPVITAPTVIGILIGALFGARIMPKLPVKPLRLIFNIVLLVLALQMIYKGFGGQF